MTETNLTVSNLTDLQKILDSLQPDKQNIVNLEAKVDVIDKVLFESLTASILVLSAVMFKIYNKI